MGRLDTLVGPIYDPPSAVREFPIGFHMSAPGPSKPEKPRVRIKAIGRHVL